MCGVPFQRGAQGGLMEVAFQSTPEKDEAQVARLGGAWEEPQGEAGANWRCAEGTEKRPKGGGTRPRVREGRCWGGRTGGKELGKGSRKGFVTGLDKWSALANLILRTRKPIFFWKASRPISKERKDFPVP